MSGGSDRGDGGRGEGSGDERHQLGLGPLPASHGGLGWRGALRELDLSSAAEGGRAPRGTAPNADRCRLQARRRRLRHQPRRLRYPPERRLPQELPRHHWLPVRRVCAWNYFKDSLLTIRYIKSVNKKLFLNVARRYFALHAT